MKVWIAFMVEAHGDDWEIIGIYSEREVAIERLTNKYGGVLFSDSDDAVVRFFNRYYIYIISMEVDGNDDAVILERISDGDWQ